MGAAPVQHHGYQSRRAPGVSLLLLQVPVAAGALDGARCAARFAAERAALKQALDVASLPMPSYSCVQPDGVSVVVIAEHECHLEQRRRERLRTEAMADERVTVKNVSDAAWVERRLSAVIAVSDEDTDDGEEDGGGEGGDDGERDGRRGRSPPAR